MSAFANFRREADRRKSTRAGRKLYLNEQTACGGSRLLQNIWQADLRRQFHSSELDHSIRPLLLSVRKAPRVPAEAGRHSTPGQRLGRANPDTVAANSDRQIPRPCLDNLTSEQSSGEREQNMCPSGQAMDLPGTGWIMATA